MSEDMHEVLSEALRSGLPEWRPIETAPNDGTRFLLAYEVGARRLVTEARRVGLSTGRHVYRMGDGGDIGIGSPRLVAWMPLPPPPKDTP